MNVVIRSLIFFNKVFYEGKFLENRDLIKLFDSIRKNKGLIKVPQSLQKNKILYDVIRSYQLDCFERASNEFLNFESNSDKIEKDIFFKNSCKLLRIFFPDSIFYYYKRNEETGGYELFFSEVQNNEIITSIEEALVEGILELVSSSQEIRSFENIYYLEKKTYLTPFPLILNNEKIGIFIAICEKKASINIDILFIFERLMQILATNINAIQLNDQLTKKKNTLSLFIDVTENISYIKTIDENIKGIILALQKAVNCSLTGIILVDKNGQLFFKYVTKDLYNYIIKHKWSFGKDIFSECIEKNISFNITDMHKSRLYSKTFTIVSDQLKSFLVYPLKAVNFVGCFFAGRLINEPSLGHEEYDIVMTMIKNLSIFLNNIALYDEIKINYELTTAALASAIEAKDPYTKGHSQRVMRYSLLIGKNFGLNESALRTIRLAAMLHDIGKIGIPEAIILKRGPLNEYEYKIMKKHPYIGYTIIKNIKYLSAGFPFVLYHHEKLNGSGYPFGLKSEKIPLFARIAAVADSFDALTSDRPYRKGLSFADAILEMQKYSGIYFDKQLVDILIKTLKS